MAKAAPAHASQTAQWNPLPRMRTHERVVSEIEKRLEQGLLKAGDRLPPERQFAPSLGVSRNAVREALRILEAIGVVEAAVGSGPSAGSVIVRDATAGIALVLRMHAHEFNADDLAEVTESMDRADLASRNGLAAALTSALQQARPQPAASAVRRAG